MKTLLVANRGEIACRILKTARNMGLQTVAVYSEADKDSMHAKQADKAVFIGPAEASASYLDSEKIIEAARQTHADAIHPGYGFLSENPDFAEQVEQAGLIFVGPPSNVIRQMGLKDAAKQKMAAANIPVVPGYEGHDQDPDFLLQKAVEIGFPVLIKARAGGGGKGMRRVDGKADFLAALESAQREAEASFGDRHVIIEKYIASPRHIEVQIISDKHGNHLHLFERDCSLQRRYQKVIEEAPAPDMPEDMRQAMTMAAVNAARSIGYCGAGTVEFIADGSTGLRADRFWFMEMNTRLQVEHPVTEQITGIDLVEWQLRVAAGETLPLRQDEISICGHAVEARLYAENPNTNFLPAPGPVHQLFFPQQTGLRVDTGIESGSAISRFYDPMVAKLTAHAPDRQTAFLRLAKALTSTHLLGTETNLSFLAKLCTQKSVLSAELDTQLIDRHIEQLTIKPSPSCKAILFACLALYNLPEQKMAGWRLWQAGQLPVSLSYDTDILHCMMTIFSQSHYHLQSGDTDTEITELRFETQGAYTSWQGISEGQFISASTVVHGKNISVSIADDRFLFSQTDYVASQQDNAMTNKLTAPMTATVTKILVKPGETVTQGQSLVLLEAMKMEYNLKAHQSATVENITVSQGQGVNEGELILTFEEQKEDKQ